MGKLFLFLSCFIAVLADMLMVIYAKVASHPLWIMIVAYVLSSIGLFIWTYCMVKGIESSTAIIVYSLFTVIGCSTLGYIVFKEQLTITNMIGIFLALIALLLIYKK